MKSAAAHEREHHTPDAATRPLQCVCQGILPYGDALRMQEQLVRQRRAQEIPDQLILLQHPHVITLGTSAHANHVLVDGNDRELLGIELFETGRGGDVTYHGPGQLVGYPVLDLKPDRCDLHRYVRDLEAVLIAALAHFAIEAHRMDGLTGVWVGTHKIAAIGVRVSSSWITSHGFALNVRTNLSYFDTIVPCGIRDHGVTSIEAVCRAPVDWTMVETVVAQEFACHFERKLVFGPANTSRKT